MGIKWKYINVSREIRQWIKILDDILGTIRKFVR